MEARALVKIEKGSRGRDSRWEFDSRLDWAGWGDLMRYDDDDDDDDDDACGSNVKLKRGIGRGHSSD
jgi:hypothetical protein